MSETPARVVVLTFDAATRSLSVTPDPISLKPGKSLLYFALQTANRGDAPEARLVNVFEDHLDARACAVCGCAQLFRVEVNNDPPAQQTPSYGYTVRLEYGGKEYVRDPTVILEPPPIKPGVPD